MSRLGKRLCYAQAQDVTSRRVSFDSAARRQLEVVRTQIRTYVSDRGSSLSVRPSVHQSVSQSTCRQCTPCPATTCETSIVAANNATSSGCTANAAEYALPPVELSVGIAHDTHGRSLSLSFVLRGLERCAGDADAGGSARAHGRRAAWRPPRHDSAVQSCAVSAQGAIRDSDGKAESAAP